MHQPSGWIYSLHCDLSAEGYCRSRYCDTAIRGTLRWLGARGRSIAFRIAIQGRKGLCPAIVGILRGSLSTELEEESSCSCRRRWWEETGRVPSRPKKSEPDVI